MKASSVRPKKAPVPSSHDQTAPPVQRDASRVGAPEPRLAYLQTWVSPAALVIRMPWLWLAVLAFQDQQVTNRSQQTSSAQEVQRYPRRYASWLVWSDVSWPPNGAGLQIQNRSVATLADVIFLGSDHLSAIRPSSFSLERRWPPRPWLPALPDRILLWTRR
jgi:hypothetical protein